MPKFGYRAVTEQYSPTALLDLVVRAEKVGFDFITASDHFHPWFHTRAHASFAWVWIASALERTGSVQLGTGVTAPSQRYHPALIAQAFATLGAVHPGRVFLALGTGEAMNEAPVGHLWLPFRDRAERLEEAVRVIRQLWEKDVVSFAGKHFTLSNARLYTKPGKPIPLYLGASGPTIAKMAGKLADGLYTIPADLSHYTEVLFPKFREGAEEARRNPETLEKGLELLVSFDEDRDKALNAIRIWGGASVPGILNMPISDPRELEKAGNDLDIDTVAKRWLITADLDEVVKKIEELLRIGFTRIDIHSGSPNEKEFIDKFGRTALVYLKDRYNQ
ncbi:MAG: TIGR03557 family F420-dependent LLM class oxidoreductase [Candidatus Bathyarchaeia archaeon]